MVPAQSSDQAPVLPPVYHRILAQGLHLDALTLVRRLHLLALCGLAVRLAQRQCLPRRCRQVRAAPRASTARSPSCCWRSCVPSGAYRIKNCMTMTGCVPGRRWRGPVACRQQPKVP